MISAHPTGAELVTQITAAAQARGVSATIFVQPLTRWPSKWLDQLYRAREPKAQTIDRIRALIDGGPIPGLGEPGSIMAQIALEAEEKGQRRAQARSTGSTVNTPLPSSRGRVVDGELPANADPVDRSPCFKCGTRGDIGCAHRPLPRSTPVAAQGTAA